ncbi:hypothetical protein G7046_g3722 [Stylonectria norvegica]|nr:hypothetical protein G7046_g3722 [Stylonectria norvegica]
MDNPAREETATDDTARAGGSQRRRVITRPASFDTQVGSTGSAGLEQYVVAEKVGKVTAHSSAVVEKATIATVHPRLHASRPSHAQASSRNPAELTPSPGRGPPRFRLRGEPKEETFQRRRGLRGSVTAVAWRQAVTALPFCSPWVLQLVGELPSS